jgi:hypothetical protein
MIVNEFHLFAAFTKGWGKAMKTVIQDHRSRAGVTLLDISKALGPGFSAARVSLAERGLIRISAQDDVRILEAIRRLGPLCGDRRRIVEVAREIDFAPQLADLREVSVGAQEGIDGNSQRS